MKYDDKYYSKERILMFRLNHPSASWILNVEVVSQLWKEHKICQSQSRDNQGYGIVSMQVNISYDWDICKGDVTGEMWHRSVYSWWEGKRNT